jgi:hypothetical protein
MGESRCSSLGLQPPPPRATLCSRCRGALPNSGFGPACDGVAPLRGPRCGRAGPRCGALTTAGRRAGGVEIGMPVCLAARRDRQHDAHGLAAGLGGRPASGPARAQQAGAWKRQAYTGGKLEQPIMHTTRGAPHHAARCLATEPGGARAPRAAGFRALLHKLYLAARLGSVALASSGELGSPAHRRPPIPQALLVCVARSTELTLTQTSAGPWRRRQWPERTRRRPCYRNTPTWRAPQGRARRGAAPAAEPKPQQTSGVILQSVWRRGKPYSGEPYSKGALRVARKKTRTWAL